MTEAQSKEIISVGVLGEMPVEGLLECVILSAQPLAQRGGGVLIVPFSLLKLRELAAKGIDLLGDIGIVEEQCFKDIIHKKQLLYMRKYLTFIIDELYPRVKGLEVIMANFSERLRELRKERGLKQKDMAEICGLKVRSYQQYEYAENYPTVPGLVFLADYFGVSLDYLMGRKDERE